MKCKPACCKTLADIDPEKYNHEQELDAIPQANVGYGAPLEIEAERQKLPSITGNDKERIAANTNGTNETLVEALIHVGKVGLSPKHLFLDKYEL